MLERMRLCKSLEQKRLRRSEPYLYDTVNFDDAVDAQELRKIAATNFGIRV